jgi:membrane protein DedA with SNARE-associated domain
LVVGCTLGILAGFIYWVVIKGLDSYIITWVAVFLAFFVVILILFYMGGKQRRRMEKELIAESNRKQLEMVKGKK